MMKKYQPLVLQRLDIRIPGLHIRQLALHRHLPETTDVQPHAHSFSQCLLYLSGQGRQQIGEQNYRTQTGTAVFLPPRRRHAFHREANRSPICLVVDFDWRGAGKWPEKVAPLPLMTLRNARQQVAGIAQLQRHATTGPSLEISAKILRLLALLLGGLGLTRAHHGEPISPVTRKVDRLLSTPESANLRLGKLARMTGYQHDYLNRLLQRHAGLTLGQYRSRQLVARAQRFLQKLDSIAEVANALGFDDPNYFSRWFRKQTGTTPREWQQNHSASLR